ncbi:asparagine synthase-related protein [Vibrio sinaloensis]|nr:asparagine synthase-related protein [Vibrio sinaloensis]
MTLAFFISLFLELTEREHWKNARLSRDTTGRRSIGGAARRYWQERYLDDLADVLSPPERGAPFSVWFLLSGGIDSLLVFSHFESVVPKSDFKKTVTIDSANSLESAQAGRVAEYFATDHCVTMVDVEEVFGTFTAR